MGKVSIDLLSPASQLNSAYQDLILARLWISYWRDALWPAADVRRVEIFALW